MTSSDNLLQYSNAAIYWHSFGFSVIPIIPGKKQSAVKWYAWLDGLSTEKIKTHWEKHPDHELGFIVGDDVIVFDADSPAAIAALNELEKTFCSPPALTVTTSKGQHHYFKRAPDTYAKSDSHSTEKHPDHIDVRTGRGLVVLPPSTGKEADIEEAENVAELTVVNQDLIDAVFIHNGRQAPRPPVVKAPTPLPLPADMDQTTARLSAMLAHVDADCGYEDWLHVQMAIYHETGGSDNGLALAIAWSSKSAKYSGEEELRIKWRSFGNYAGTPVTVGTIHKMLTDRGIDWIDVCDALEPQFESRESKTIVVHNDSELTSEAASDKQIDRPIVLTQFSLSGSSAELEAEALAQVYVLASIALLGQWTVLYARHNTGKTLIVIYLLVETIRNGTIKAADIFYFNLDDTQRGLTEKLKIAEEMGFHILCDGYRGFKVADFISHIAELCENDQARGVVLVLDTLKKFTDLMDKRRASRWGEVIRRFISKGGTVIGLAHVNKNPGADGKAVYTGTTDIIDDADCAYVLDVVSTDDKTNTKIVEFENRKRRGNVVNRVSYSFSIEDGLSYQELLASVCLVDELELVAVKQAEAIKSDTDIISGVIACINDGINTKLRLRDAVSDRIGCSKRTAVRIIEKYDGTDTAVHKWCHAVGDRGAQVFSLLIPDSAVSDLAGKP